MLGVFSIEFILGFAAPRLRDKVAWVFLVVDKHQHGMQLCYP